MKLKCLLVGLAILAFAGWAFAADITGTWKGTAETPAGKVQRTFNFKVDGSKLTGEATSDVLGNSTIQDGKINGDTITFTIDVTIQGNQAKANYTGKVEGDQIKMSVKVEGVEQTIEYSITRVK
ncbi:MAG TPA: hypothetical protein VG206_25285 [Terriglobia bacterium]|nr:hypothetical protein [Terriglobia bacterium]